MTIKLRHIPSEYIVDSNLKLAYIPCCNGLRSAIQQSEISIAYDETFFMMGGSGTNDISYCPFCGAKLEVEGERW